MRQMDRQMLDIFARDKSKPQDMTLFNARGESLTLTLRQLTAEDFDPIRRLELEIVAGIPNNDTENIYQSFEEDSLRYALGTGYAFAMYQGGMPAAFVYMIPRPPLEHNVLTDVAQEVGLVKWNEKDVDGQAEMMDQGNTWEYDPAIHDVMIADCIIVDKRFRGYGLQRLLFGLMDAMAQAEGLHRLCGTASPKNAYSIRNFEASGYRCVAVKPKYRSERCFFVKEL